MRLTFINTKVIQILLLILALTGIALLAGNRLLFAAGSTASSSAQSGAAAASLPPLGPNDRCNDTYEAVKTVAEFMVDFQTGPLAIYANNSTTIVRLYEGEVYIAQQYMSKTWKVGSMPLKDFLQALENSGSTKIPGKMRYILDKNMTNKVTLNAAEMKQKLGWDGVCP